MLILLDIETLLDTAELVDTRRADVA
jgi:hypothetical protein